MVTLLLSLALAQPPPPVMVEKLPGIREAHAEALADLLGQPPPLRPFLRYLWVANGSHEDARLNSFGLAWLSSTPIRRPAALVGKATLQRIDLTTLARDRRELERWLRLWEEFTFDPSQSVLITPDVINLLLLRGVKLASVQKVEGGRILTKTAPWKQGDKTYTSKWLAVLRSPVDEVDGPTLARLEQETGSTAPVVEGRYFLLRALSSLKEQEPYTTIYGGLYYDLAGVRTAKAAGKKKATDLDQLLEDLGVVDDSDQVKFQEKFDRLGSDQRVAMKASKVTGRERAIFLFPTLASIRSRAVLTITQDRKKGNIDILKNPFFNLLDFKPDAQEAIWTKANGTQGYALFDANGKLQLEVPPDIANDSTIPRPHNQRLEILSCWCCHGLSDRAGWQEMPNQVNAPLRDGLTILGDLSERDQAIYDTQLKIAQKYAGNADELLRDLRRGTLATVLRATGPWPHAENKDQLGIARLAAEHLGRIRNQHWYEGVSPEVALRELGYRVLRGGKELPAVEALKVLFPPSLEDRDPVLGLIPEDIRIGQLKDGLGLSREEWDLGRGFFLNRAWRNYQRLQKQP